MDIETTGLSRKKNMIYLIGILYKDKKTNAWKLKQYLANTMDKEKRLLEEFMEDLSLFDQIITYNGDSFDLPFIEHRLSHYGINQYIDRSKSYDVYRIIRQNKNYLDLENLKLKTIEESLGFFREDMYSGFDCIGFYHNYIKSQDKILKENILKHNYDDLAHMLDIMEILDVLDEKKSFNINHMNLNIKFTIDTIEVINDMINISGNISPNLEKNIKYYAHTYNIVTDKLNHFKISIEIKEGYITQDDKCIYIDLLKLAPLILIDNSGYNLPDNLFVLLIEKKYCISNIKNLLTTFFQNLITL